MWVFWLPITVPNSLLLSPLAGEELQPLPRLYLYESSLTLEQSLWNEDGVFVFLVVLVRGKSFRPLGVCTGGGRLWQILSNIPLSLSSSSLCMMPGKVYHLTLTDSWPHWVQISPIDPTVWATSSYSCQHNKNWISGMCTHFNKTMPNW